MNMNCERRTSNWLIAPSILKISSSRALRNWFSQTRKLAVRWPNAKRCVANYWKGKKLTALNVGLKSLLDRQSRSGLDSRVQRLQELATQTARDLHRVAVELRPAALH